MFSAGSYTSTYTGPFEASGETLRRNRNDGYALAASAGQRRNYLAPGRGVGAGSGAMQYRAGLEADTAAARAYGTAQQTMLSNLMSNADSRFAYQNNQADEMNMLRGLQLQRNAADQNFDLTARGDRIERDLALKKLKAERDAGVAGNNMAFLSALLGVA